HRRCCARRSAAWWRPAPRASTSASTAPDRAGATRPRPHRADAAPGYPPEVVVLAPEVPDVRSVLVGGEDEVVVGAGDAGGVGLEEVDDELLLVLEVGRSHGVNTRRN